MASGVRVAAPTQQTGSQASSPDSCLRLHCSTEPPARHVCTMFVTHSRDGDGRAWRRLCVTLTPSQGFLACPRQPAALLPGSAGPILAELGACARRLATTLPKPSHRDPLPSRFPHKERGRVRSDARSRAQSHTQPAWICGAPCVTIRSCALSDACATCCNASRPTECQSHCAVPVPGSLAGRVATRCRRACKPIGKWRDGDCTGARPGQEGRLV